MGRGEEGTEGKLQGKEGRDMHGTAQIYQLLMCNTMAHHAFFLLLYLHTDTSFLQKKSMGSKIKNKRWNKNNVNMLKIETWNRKGL